MTLFDLSDTGNFVPIPLEQITGDVLKTGAQDYIMHRIDPEQLERLVAAIDRLSEVLLCVEYRMPKL